MGVSDSRVGDLNELGGINLPLEQKALGQWQHRSNVSTDMKRWGGGGGPR